MLFLKAQGWDDPSSWTRVTEKLQKTKDEYMFVNQVAANDDGNYYMDSDGPDLCPIPFLEKVTIFYCKEIDQTLWMKRKFK